MINKQSNIYTIVYASLLVFAVGITLAIIYQALRPQQLENIANDTRRQILAAARLVPEEGTSVADLYAEHIKADFLVDSQGHRIESDIDPFSVNVGEETKKAASERLLPVFECSTTDGMKYIIPVYGAGLWGPIWGYIAFDDDGKTIYGAYFAHQGETPGLGAEIEKPAFSSQFDGKDVFDPEGKFTSVAVLKAGQKVAPGTASVNAVSGGTITSQGVQKMLRNSLEPYVPFLKSLDNDQ